jgi:hypothetical protein
MNEVTQARICLLDPKRKTAYDERLRSKLGPQAAPPAKPAPRAAPAAPPAPKPAPARLAQSATSPFQLKAAEPRARHRPHGADRPSWLVLGNTYASSMMNGFSPQFHRAKGKTTWLDFKTGGGGPRVSLRTQYVIVWEQWNHVALVVDRPSTTARFHVNGLEVPCHGTIDPSFRTKAAWLFGADPPTACGYRGLLDDFRIYNRVLSPAEIQNLRKLAI